MPHCTSETQLTRRKTGKASLGELTYKLANGGRKGEYLCQENSQSRMRKATGRTGRCAATHQSRYKTPFASGRLGPADGDLGVEARVDGQRSNNPSEDDAHNDVGLLGVVGQLGGVEGRRRGGVGGHGVDLKPRCWAVE